MWVFHILRLGTYFIFFESLSSHLNADFKALQQVQTLDLGSLQIFYMTDNHSVHSNNLVRYCPALLFRNSAIELDISFSKTGLFLHEDAI